MAGSAQSGMMNDDVDTPDDDILASLLGDSEFAEQIMSEFSKSGISLDDAQELFTQHGLIPLSREETSEVCAR
jgi:hypothetical protein